MKAKKRLSILLSALLTLNLLHVSSYKAKAEEIANPITLKSVSVNETFLWPGSEAIITVDASSTAAEMESQASALLVQQSGSTQIEKELTLTLNGNKYEAVVPMVDNNDIGTYKLSCVILADKLQNTQIFYNSDVHGFGTNLSAANFKVDVDNDAPAMPKITLNQNVLYPSNTLNVTLESSDSVSGLAKEANLVYVNKASDGDIEKEMTLSLVNGKYVGTMKLDDSFPIGNWKLSFVVLSDNAGNISMIYNSKVHQNMGSDLSAGDFTVILDEEGPQVSSISVGKKLAKLGDKIGVSVVANDVTGLANEANVLYTIDNNGTPIEKSVTLALVNGSYVGDLTVDESFISGKYSVSFVALQDSLGNSSGVYNSKIHGIGQDLSAADFTVDLTAPNAPSIAVSTEELTNKDVTVTITAPEVNALVEYKLLNDTVWTVYTAPFNVSANTIITARATDLAGNVSDIAVKNVNNIDKQAPVISIVGVKDKGMYNGNLNIVVSVDDETAVVTKSLTLDGAPIEFGTLTLEGTYVLKVSAVDTVGNSAQVEYSFVIERTAPIITVTGVENNGLYNHNVTPGILVDDSEATVTKTLTLNGQPVAFGTLDKDGTYVLKVEAVDLAGNKSSVEYTFVIDKTAPVITISGVANNGAYNHDVTPVIAVDDAEAVVTKALTLNGQPVAIGALNLEGAYVLKVEATDKAGNKSTVEYSFVIDKTAPVITVTGVENNKVYDKVVTPIVSVDDENATVTMKLNGKDYTGSDISLNGQYTLVVTAVDKAGNSSTTTLNFTVSIILITTDPEKSVEEINAAPVGSTIVIQIGENNEVDSTVLSAIAGQDKTIVLEKDGIEWTFNGLDITKDIKNVDLSVQVGTKTDAGTPNKSAIASLVKDTNIMILTFGDNGILPGKAKVTISLGSAWANKENLVFYYFNPTTGKAEKVQGGLKADELGNITVEITHCSDYFVADKELPSPVIPKTGSPIDMSSLIAFGVILMGLGALVLTRRRKTE